MARYLDAGAPLYGRAAEAFAVRPLRPGHLSEVFAVEEARELVSMYALWGGHATLLGARGALWS